MITCGRRINMDGVSVQLRVELCFDPKLNGAYCQVWEAFEAPAQGEKPTKHIDLQSLPHDQFYQVAQELQELIKYGVQLYYQELEDEYHDFMLEASFNRNHGGN